MNTASHYGHIEYLSSLQFNCELQFFALVVHDLLVANHRAEVLKQD